VHCIPLRRFSSNIRQSRHGRLSCPGVSPAQTGCMGPTHIFLYPTCPRGRMLTQAGRRRRRRRSVPHLTASLLLAAGWLLAAAPRHHISSMYHHHDDTVHVSMARRILWRCEETARHVQGRYARPLANVIHRASPYHIQMYMQYGDVVLVEEYDTGSSPSRWSCLSLCLSNSVSAATSGTFFLWQVDTEVECCEMTMLIDRGR
jgi:hypothetical protein